MTDTPIWAKYRYECLLAGILILSAFLNLWNLWNQGYSNAYYAAAVRSMLANPSLLFFNSFDAAGFITVDKPPVGLWVQALSAALLGFSGWSLVLPQALAGVGSVALVYLIVSRAFGKPAGLVSALAFAITPIFVAVSRNGTMDGILIFVLLLAVWVALKAARESSFPCLLLAVVLIGIGFNIKMIQALIVVPAVLAIYLLGAREYSAGKRAIHLVIAVAVLAAVSLSWAVAVDAIPTDQRPYIGGSGDNTVLGLIVNYNGIHRLESDSSGAGGNRGGLISDSPSMGGGTGPGNLNGAGSGPGGMQNRTTSRGGFAMGDAQPPGMTQASGVPPGSKLATGPSSGGPAGNQSTRPGMVPGSSADGGFPGSGNSPGTGRGGGMGDETGSPGIARLFSEGLAAQITWLLPLALIGLLALWRRPAALSLKGLEDTGLFREKGLTLMAMSLWLLPGLIYFSFTTGFWHTYYLATIAPPLAALAGIGAVAMYAAYTGDGIKRWILVAAAVVTGTVQVIFLLYTATWSGPLTAIVGIGTAAVSLLLAIRILKDRTGTGLVPKAAATVAIALLLIAPFVWSCTPLMYGSGNILPRAGPQLGGMGNGGPGGMGGGMNSQPGDMTGGSTSGLASYLLAHTTSETWILAAPSSMSISSLIIETGKPVMSLGGFAGSDRVLTLDEMKQMVADGKVRFFSLGGGMGGGGDSGNSAIFSWVQSTCTAVPASSYGGTTGSQDILSSGAGSGNRSVSGQQEGMSGLAGISGMNTLSAFGQGGLYDCGNYRGMTGA